MLTSSLGIQKAVATDDPAISHLLPRDPSLKSATNILGICIDIDKANTTTTVKYIIFLERTV
jgi:hypothetical protein